MHVFKVFEKSTNYFFCALLQRAQQGGNIPFRTFRLSPITRFNAQVKKVAGGVEVYQVSRYVHQHYPRQSDDSKFASDSQRIIFRRSQATWSCTRLHHHLSGGIGLGFIVGHDSDSGVTRPPGCPEFPLLLLSVAISSYCMLRAV